MSWAGGRRLVILLIVGAVVVAFLTILSFSVFYQAPSCFDGRQNQGEAGIDCGSPCAYLCAELEKPPTVLFTQTVSNGEGRTDVVAEVENKNPDAAVRGARYHISIYGPGQELVGSSTGAIDLPPNSVVPVFVPSVAAGGQVVVGKFLEVESSSLHWLSMPVDRRVVPTVSGSRLGGTASAPRVYATLTNPSTSAVSNIRVVVFIRNSQGDIISASATLVASIPPLGQASALFTWNAPFAGVPSEIEVIPVVPLP